jgi:YD repeat-containing protein
MTKTLSYFFSICTVYMCILFSPSQSMAQTYPTNSFVTDLVVPSPQSRAFTRYGDYPMNGNTGLVDISVPLYEVRSRSLKCPISMSFHASGRMANETNGILGMRWTLNVGGVVSRNLKGRPDEWYALAPYTVNPDVAPTFDALHNACVEGFNLYNTPTMTDSEYDLFNYLLPNGKQGHFILKKVNNVFVPMFMPYSEMKILPIGDPNYLGYFKKIEIIDTDGTRYIFGGDSLPFGGNVEFLNESPHDNLQSIPTAWYINKIISADGVDEITFSYFRRRSTEFIFNESVSISDRWSYNTAVLINDPLDPYMNNLSDFLYTNPLIENTGFTEKNYETPTISGITFRGGSITFNYINKSTSTNFKMLDEISIATGSTRKIKFNSILHPLEPNVHYLKDVSFMGEGSSQNIPSEIYRFDYYEPSFVTVDGRGDWWGYLMNGLQHTLPYQTISTSRPTSYGNFGYDRNIGYFISKDGDEGSKKIGMLKNITYPTGGSTEFIYESNQYDNNQFFMTPFSAPAPINGPGLRIKELISNPLIGPSVHKHFKYGPNESGVGYLNESFRPIALYSPNFCLVKEGMAMHFWDWGSTSHGGSVYGGYRTREYLSSPYIRFDLEGNPLNYDTVTEYTEQNGALVNKVLSYYHIKPFLVKDFIVNDYIETLQYTRKFSDPDNAWDRPVLREKIFYKREGNLFAPTRSESYEYEIFERGSVWDMPTYRHSTVEVSYGSYPYQNMDHYQKAALVLQKEKFCHENLASIYGYGFRKYNSNDTKLIKTIVKDYTDNGVVATNKTFTYEPISLLLRSEETIGSRNDTIKSIHFYPSDFSGMTVYNEMLSKNRLDTKIRTDTYSDSTLLTSERINYANWGNGLFSPLNYEAKTGANPYEIRTTYIGYDNLNNLKGVIKDGNVKICYVYGYDGLLPIAKIENADYATVESCLGGANAVQAFRDIVSPTDIQVENFLSPLRISSGLTEAFITTYTYKPLTGITSMTDAKGMTTYYEYDGFGRLKNILDRNRDIVKSFAYNYAGAPTPTTYHSAAYSASFTKNDCGTGTGSAVAYTVPANMYSSTVSQAAADLLAQNDANANGQAHANANGNCTAVCTGDDKKMIGSNCETGVKVYAGSVASGNKYICTFHYLWSDSSISGDHTEVSSYPCMYERREVLRTSGKKQ